MPKIRTSKWGLNRCWYCHKKTAGSRFCSVKHSLAYGQRNR